MPITSHGTTRVAPTRPAQKPLPRKRNRVIPHAVAVPRTTQAGATMDATMSELRSESWTLGSARAVLYHSRVKPSKGSEMIVESLNEKTVSSTIGPTSTTRTTETSPSARTSPILSR